MVDPQVRKLEFSDHGHLLTAFESLERIQTFYNLFSIENKKIAIQCINDKVLRFEISYRYINNGLNIDFTDWRYSPLETAALILHQHGSELKIHTDDKGVTFDFDLPVWDDPPT